MDREVYKFRFPEMEQVTKAFLDFVNATFKFGEISNKDAEEIVNETIAKTEMGECIDNTIELAKVLVPLGLRIPKGELNNMDAEEFLKYHSAVMKVNKGFFTELWGNWNDSVGLLPGKPKETDSSKSIGEEQPTLTSVD